MGDKIEDDREFGSVSEGASARSLALLWGTLAEGLLRPTLQLAAEVRKGEFARKLESVLDRGSSQELDAALGALVGFADANQGRTDEELRLALEVEYNRLFVGPLKLVAPPYESYYASSDASGEGGRLRTQDEFDVKAAYAAAGYRMPHEFVELPDHVAVELDFLALLAQDEATAWEQGDEKRARTLQEVEDAFAAGHPCRWFAALSERVGEGSRLAFYPSLLRVACTVLGI